MRCGSPRCLQQADYIIPQGSTPRTRTRSLQLCIQCLDKYLELVSTSILLPGDPCEWELTVRALENIFDGGHDHLEDLMRETCGHRSCAASREGGAVISEEAAHAS